MFHDEEKDGEEIIRKVTQRTTIQRAFHSQDIEIKNQDITDYEKIYLPLKPYTVFLKVSMSKCESLQSSH